MARYLIKHRGKEIFVVLLSLSAPRYLGYALLTDFFGGGVGGVAARIWVCFMR